jgi:hypothetical protein
LARLTGGSLEAVFPIRHRANEAIAQHDSAARALGRLARTFPAQIEALNRYRSHGEPAIIGSECCQAFDSGMRRYGISGPKAERALQGRPNQISHHCRFLIRGKTTVCGCAVYQICSFYPRPAC